MAQKTLPPTASTAIVGVIEPDATAVGTVTTDWIDMSQTQALMAIIQVGALGAAATVDAMFEQATDAAGTNVKDIDGAAITQLTKVNGDDNKQAVIQFWGEDLDIANDFKHVRLSISVAGADSDLSAIVLGLHARQGPASNHNVDSVVELVTVNAT